MNTAATILLLLLLAGLLASLAKGGWTGPGGAEDWFKAKFLGQTA